VTRLAFCLWRANRFSARPARLQTSAPFQPPHFARLLSALDLALKTNRDRIRHALLLVALAPVIPQLLGSVFNIWYNAVVIQPLLETGALRPRFFLTVIAYNLIAYPIGILLWLWNVFSLGPIFQRLRADLPVEDVTLARAR